MSAANCPKCARAMTGGKLGPIRLALCLPCQGVWLGTAELQQLVKAGPEVIRRLGERVSGNGSAHASGTAKSSLTCPHCAVPLASTQSSTLPGVRTDYCRFCSGYWMEAEALERIAVLMSPRPAAAPAPPPTPVAPPSAPVTAPAQPVAAPTFEGYFPSIPNLYPPLPKAGKTTTANGTSLTRASTNKLPTVSAIERLTCSSCGEGNGPDAAVCWACGKAFIGQIIGTCPRCEGYLREVESAGVRVGACEGCNGVWAEEGRLIALLRQPETAREQIIRQVERTRTGKIKKLNHGLVCRNCELILLRAPMMVSSEPVDTCPGCSGTFLEEGVLPLMLRSGEVW